MHAEIEGLLIAYGREQSKEQKLVADLLTALAELSSNRQRTFDSIAAATSQLQQVNGHSFSGLHGLGRQARPLTDEIEQALDQLRRCNGHAAHH